MEHGNWISTSLVYLAAAVLAVPLARLLGLGAIIGYLGAGIVIGPWGLKLVSDPAAMLHFAEFGVVLMLFLVGLELEPRRLWAMRRPIFGGGSVQLLGSAALMGGVGLALGLDWRLALVAGLGLGMSSTAIGLAVLALVTAFFAFRPGPGKRGGAGRSGRPGRKPVGSCRRHAGGHRGRRAATQLVGRARFRRAVVGAQGRPAARPDLWQVPRRGRDRQGRHGPGLRG
mgnify:CR=1 FL=1